MYRLLKNSDTIVREADKTFFSPNSDNPAARAYQEWIAEGNEPLPAIEPPEPKVTEVTQAQARLALLEVGLLDEVENRLKTFSRGAQIRWEYSPSLSRNDELLNEVGELLGLNEEQIDRLFKRASEL